MKNRRTRRRVLTKGRGEMSEIAGTEIENVSLDQKGLVDWTSLPDDTLIQIFSCLNYRDRASFSSTSRTLWSVGKTPCLWKELDLRFHKFDATAASSLASRCEKLEQLHFRGHESASSVINLQARNLREISGDRCRKMTDAMLSVLVARHEALESIYLGEYCEKISSNAVKAIAICCPKLQKLCLVGIREVDAGAINALAKNCPNLTDIGFLNCQRVDETALGNVASLRFLSVAGTTIINWDVVPQQWSKLPNLIALDVCRTYITPVIVAKLFSSCPSLKVLCAFSCPSIELDHSSSASDRKLGGQVILAMSTNILKGLATLFGDAPKNIQNVFLDWRNSKAEDKGTCEIITWLESAISASLLHAAENDPPGFNDFWLNQGTALLLSFLQSPLVEIQERAAAALAGFVVLDEESASIDTGKAEAVVRDGGISLLLNLAGSWRVGLQAEAAKALANLSVDPNVAKTVANEGGASVLVNLAGSDHRLVVEEAAGGLWNLSVGEENKDVIFEAGGLKALVDVIVKWSNSNIGHGVLERAAGALANLAADEKCSLEIASAGGVHALVTLARTSNIVGVQEQACRAIANLAAHGDRNDNNAAIGQEEGALETLVQLTHSPSEGVRQEAAGALWNLSFEETNREAIAAAGGVEALVALAQSCSNASPGLQERAAGALWGLSVSEANSIAIGREGGVAPLIALARSYVEDVQETAAGALWNLAFNPGNALRIIEFGGIPALIQICATSVSKLARFMSALALTYMSDGRIDEIARKSSGDVNIDSIKRMALDRIKAFVETYCNLQALTVAAVSSSPNALVQVAESIYIQEAGLLRCSGNELGRFIAMLRNPSTTLKGCAAFALVQFTTPGGRHAMLHTSLLKNAGAPRVLRAAAAASGSSVEARIFARIVLRNLEQVEAGSSAGGTSAGASSG